MSTNNKFAQKKTFKKSPYGNAKHLTNKEILAIRTKYNEDKSKDKKHPIHFDTSNETTTEAMTKNDIRYLQIMITDIDGKARPLLRTNTATKTASKCVVPEPTDGKMSSSCSFSTAILIRVETGDVISREDARELLAPVDEAEWDERVAEFTIDKTVKVTPKFVEAAIKVATEVLVDEQFPNISDDQREEKLHRQIELLTEQYNQWCVEKWISTSFEQLLNDKKIRKDIKWVMSDKQDVQGNVQTHRKARENDDGSINAEDDALLDKLSAIAGSDVKKIPLDVWRTYYKIRIDSKDGSLWCKIYDRLGTTTVGGKKVRKLATLKNPTTGKIEVLNNQTIESWLRYGSVFTGHTKYQLCISSKGARLHATIPEMEALRAAKSEQASKIDEAESAIMDEFGGNFAADDDDDEMAAPARVVPAKTKELTGIERQLQDLDAAANDE